MPATQQEDACYISQLIGELGKRLREIEELQIANMSLRKRLDVAEYNWRLASVEKTQAEDRKVWIVVPATEDSSPAHPYGRTIGYLVRSAIADSERYWWVGHYYAAENGDPSLTWCQMAADRHADRLNREGRQPWEFAAKHERRAESAATSK